MNYEELTPMHRKRYGGWAGNVNGNKPDPARCAEVVWDGFHSHQYLRKRGHGQYNAFCKQHARLRGGYDKDS